MFIDALRLTFTLVTAEKSQSAPRLPKKVQSLFLPL
jgi:hypothetical protein